MRRRTSPSWVSAGIVLAVGLVATGCASGGDEIVPPGTFDGLDPRVVEEVIANPAMLETITATQDEVYRRGFAQGIVINVIACRDALRVLEEWRATGVRGELAPLPLPRDPVSSAYEALLDSHEARRVALASGEIAELQELIDGQGGCGVGVPAVAGDLSGPSVADRAHSAAGP